MTAQSFILRLAQAAAADPQFYAICGDDVQRKADELCQEKSVLSRDSWRGARVGLRPSTMGGS